MKKEFELFNPYSTGDVLVFKSPKKVSFDTLYIFRISKFYYDGFTPPFSKIYQGLSVDAHIPHYFDTNRSLRSTEIFMILPKDKIGFYLTLNKNVDFYSTQEPSVKSNLYQSTITVEAGGKKYTDVVVIESTSPYINERENDALKAYWSLSQGYIALEMKNGERYELVSKYRDEKKCKELKERLNKRLLD